VGYEIFNFLNRCQWNNFFIYLLNLSQVVVWFTFIFSLYSN